MEQQILQLLDKLPPISLSEMSEIKLMNRIDKKYLATIDQLKQLLVMAQGKYMVQQIEGKRYNRYHTIYLDTPDEEMYTMHHNGRLAIHFLPSTPITFWQTLSPKWKITSSVSR